MYIYTYINVYIYIHTYTNINIHLYLSVFILCQKALGHMIRVYIYVHIYICRYIYLVRRHWIPGVIPVAYFWRVGWVWNVLENVDSHEFVDWMHLLHGVQCVAVHAVCCSMLQSVQCVAMCCGVLRWEYRLSWLRWLNTLVAVFCSVLQCVAVCCSMLLCVEVCCSALQLEYRLQWLRWLNAPV